MPCRPDDGAGAVDRPLRADRHGERRQQLGHVDRDLTVGRGQLGEAEVDDPGAPRASTITLAVRSERWAMPARCRRSTSVHRRSSMLVGDLVARHLRRASGRRPGPSPATPSRRPPRATRSTWGTCARRLLRHQADQRLVLDRLARATPPGRASPSRRSRTKR